MTDKIKSCPFCGGDNVGIWENRAPASKDFRYYANCYDCHISLGFEKTKEEAIEKWNTRKPMDRIVEQLEKELYRGMEGLEPVKVSFNFGINTAIEIVKAGGKNE